MSDTPESPSSVGRHLKRRREALDLTQPALAGLIGVGPSTVSLTERGRTQIQRGKRAAWEQALSLRPGTITRAYRDGTPIETLEGVSLVTAEAAEPAKDADASAPVAPHTDLSDPHERAIWEMKISEADKRELIRLLRIGREQDHKRLA